MANIDGRASSALRQALEMQKTINNTEMVSAPLEFTVHSSVGVVGKTQTNK